MSASAAAAYDVVVVGAGVVGVAVARELGAFDVRVAVIDAADDVGAGTSKANTAILHTGFDARPGTLEARLVRRGHAMLSDYAARTGIPVETTGAVLVAWDDEQVAALPALLDKARANEYDAARLVGVEELYALEPFLGAGARAGLVVPDEGIVCPWTTPLAFATEAVHAGVELLLSTRLDAVAVDDDDRRRHLLHTSAGPVACSWLVNAAGLQSDVVDRMLGHDDFTVVPRRGELVVLDKTARRLLRHVLLPVPTSRGKGVLVAPTVYGNVLLGPTAEDLEDRRDTATTGAGLAALRAHGRRILPALLDEEVTAAYAGLRAATEHDDYVVRCHGEQRYVCVGGIRSTGLTASMAIAEHVLASMRQAGFDAAPSRRPSEPPPMPYIGEVSPRPYRRADLVARDPAYGTVVCHCERVTLGEVRDALGATVPAHGVDGVRRRTRATGGRCQGFYCGARVRALVDEARARP